MRARKSNKKAEQRTGKPIQSIQSNRRSGSFEIPLIQTVFVPHSVTRDRMRKFLKAYEVYNGNVSAACAAAGVKRAAYYRWMKSHSEMCRGFRERLKRIRPEERLKDKLEFAANVLIEEAHPQFVMFALRTKARDRGWSERVEPDPVEKTTEQELNFLLMMIKHRAEVKGRTFREEVQVFLNIFRPTLKPELTESLEQMI